MRYNNERTSERQYGCSGGHVGLARSMCCLFCVRVCVFASVCVCVFACVRTPHRRRPAIHYPSVWANDHQAAKLATPKHRILRPDGSAHQLSSNTLLMLMRIQGIVRGRRLRREVDCYAAAILVQAAWRGHRSRMQLEVFIAKMEALIHKGRLPSSGR